MLKQSIFRRLLLGLSTGLALAVAGVSVPIVVGAVTPAYAQVSAEFQGALEPYGQWRRHSRFGEVWVPHDRPAGWRPYTYGRWVYTDDWGWYWASDDQEADWGWVTYHYGRWSHDREIGWFWVPGNEWAPAWVDWRRGGEYVGWAPSQPDDVVYEYDNDPDFWIFVPPRYMAEPRVRVYVLPPQRTIIVIRETIIVNRTVRIEQRDNRTRIAVNPGIAPGIVAAAAHRPVQTFRVQPRVVAGTQGVTGAVQVRPQDIKRNRQGGPQGAGRPNPLVQATLQPTKTVVQPLKEVPKPQPLGKDEHGRLGATPPRAAQGATVAPPPQPGTTPPRTGPAPTTTPTTPPAPTPGATPSGQPPGGAPPRTGPAPTTTPTPPRSPNTGIVPPAQPPGGTPPRTGPAPTTTPTTPRPPAPGAGQSGQPPQATPTRPVTPPPPPPPAQSAPRPQPQVTPPPVAHPAPPQQPAPPPVARPAPPPPPPAARAPAPPPPPAARAPAPPSPSAQKPAAPPKPGEKPEEKK